MSSSAHDLASLGGNQSIYDQFPDLHDHPIWKAVDTPVERVYVLAVDETVWRNLHPNPSSEQDDGAAFISGTGGTVEVGVDWEVEV